MTFLPHGYCFAWSPGLLWSMVGADSLIAAAYFSIPIAIVTIVRQRHDSTLTWIPWLFSGFIFTCGVTHVMDVWTIWEPSYRMQALAKLLTAAISVLTAVVLWWLIPHLLAIPKVADLQAAIQSLEAEARRRRVAEDSLVHSQQSLAVTLASIGAGFIATDRAGRVTHMNAVAERLTGWAESEARGRILWEVFVRGDAATVGADNPVDMMIEQRITVETGFQVDVVARDGARTAVEFKGDLTHDAEGRVRGAAMVFRDLSRLMRAEAEAKRLAAIVEYSNDAIIGKDPAGRITAWNQAAARMFGYTAAEVTGQSVLMLVAPEREAEERAHLATLAAGAVVPTFDTLGIARDGRRLQLSVSVSPIRDAGGAVIGASRIARDVSEQRRAEAALRDSEAQLRLTMEAGRIGEWDLDLATGLAQHSARHAQCFGYEGEVPGWGFETFKRHVHPDDRAEVERSFAAGLREPGGVKIECRVIWPDGSIHWISARGSAFSEGGIPVRVRGVVTDVTEQKQAEQSRLNALRLETENREILEASRLKSLFLANMSHELRTPLNAIIGFSDLLHSGAVPAESPKRQEFLGFIAASGRQLLQLINDILDLSKVESGKFEFNARAVHLAGLVREVQDVFFPAASAKAVTFVCEIDPSLEEGVTLDPTRLKQALSNYVSNAVKFTPRGGHVIIRALPVGTSHLRIEVEDDGIGIAEADQSKLFNEFQQLDAGMSKQHQGTGLGLSLTRRLIEAQGGSVGVRSAVGRGSVFHFVLNRIHGTDPPRGRATLPAGLGRGRPHDVA